MNHNAFALLVIKHARILLARGTGPYRCVHVDDTVDAVNGCTGGEVGALHVLHVFFYRDVRLAIFTRFEDGVNVKVDRSSNLCQVVRRNAV